MSLGQSQLFLNLGQFHFPLQRLDAAVVFEMGFGEVKVVS
jgi:hypothetical protein